MTDLIAKIITNPNQLPGAFDALGDDVTPHFRAFYITRSVGRTEKTDAEMLSEATEQFARRYAGAEPLAAYVFEYETHNLYLLALDLETSKADERTATVQTDESGVES